MHDNGTGWKPSDIEPLPGCVYVVFIVIAALFAAFVVINGFAPLPS